MLYHNYNNYNTSVKRRITAVIRAREELEEARRAYEVARNGILEELREAGGIQKGDILIEYIPASTALLTDTTKLRREHPEIYALYRKEQNRSEGVKIKQKRQVKIPPLGGVS